MQSATRSSPNRPYLPFALQWIAANALGQIAGIGSIYGGSEVLGLWRMEDTWVGIFGCGMIPGTGAAAGGLVGLLQWWVLHHHGWQLDAKAWVIRTAVGGALAWILGI